MPRASRMAETHGVAASPLRLARTVEPISAPMNPGPARIPTVRQSTLPDLWWARPETRAVPRSGKGAAAERAAGGVPAAERRRGDDSRAGEEPARAPVHVAELVGGDAGDQSRSQFGEVHRRRSGSRCRTRGQEQGRRGHPIGHAEGSVDELSDEADEAENDEL